MIKKIKEKINSRQPEVRRTSQLILIEKRPLSIENTKVIYSDRKGYIRAYPKRITNEYTGYFKVFPEGDIQKHTLSEEQYKKLESKVSSTGTLITQGNHFLYYIENKKLV